MRKRDDFTIYFVTLILNASSEHGDVNKHEARNNSGSTFFNFINELAPPPNFDTIIYTIVVTPFHFKKRYSVPDNYHLFVI